MKEQELSPGTVRWLPLDSISDTDFNREPGDLDSLKKSIEQNGLITPLACTPEYKLLVGRRRFVVLKALDWDEAPFLVINPENKIKQETIMFHENIKRKPLTDAENRRAIVKIDRLKREKHGDSPRGRRWEGNSSESDELEWSDEKTAEELGIGQSKVTEAKQADDFEIETGLQDKDLPTSTLDILRKAPEEIREEVVEEVKKTEDKVSNTDLQKQIKRKKKQKKIEKIKEEAKDTPYEDMTDNERYVALNRKKPHIHYFLIPGQHRAH
jgi:hypothetical protein